MPAEISVPSGFREVGREMDGREMQTGSVLVQNEYGLDILTRPFRVRLDRALDLLPKEGEVDFRYKTLSYATHRLTEGSGFHGELVIEYVGHIRGTRANGEPVMGRRFEAVQVTTDDDENVELTYHAPYTTFRYVTDGEPRQPRYSGPILLGPNSITIITTRPANFTGNLRVRQEYSIRNQLESWGAKRRGRYYEVDEEWVRRIVPNNGVQDKPAILMRGSFASSPVGHL